MAAILDCAIFSQKRLGQPHFSPDFKNFFCMMLRKVNRFIWAGDCVDFEHVIFIAHPYFKWSFVAWCHVLITSLRSASRTNTMLLMISMRSAHRKNDVENRMSLKAVQSRKRNTFPSFCYVAIRNCLFLSYKFPLHREFPYFLKRKLWRNRLLQFLFRSDWLYIHVCVCVCIYLCVYLWLCPSDYGRSF